MSDSEDLIAELEATVSWLKRINELVDADRVQRAIAALAAQRHTHGEEWAKEYATARRAEYLLSDENVERAVRGIQAQALRDAAYDFDRAAAAGIEPTLNHTAARLLRDRAHRLEQMQMQMPAALSAVLSEGESS